MYQCKAPPLLATIHGSFTGDCHREVYSPNIRAFDTSIFCVGYHLAARFHSRSISILQSGNGIRTWCWTSQFVKFPTCLHICLGGPVGVGLVMIIAIKWNNICMYQMWFVSVCVGNKWLQQQIPACRPVFTAKHVFVLFLSVGIIFLILGIVFVVVAVRVCSISLHHVNSFACLVCLHASDWFAAWESERSLPLPPSLSLPPSPLPAAWPRGWLHSLWSGQ